MDDKKAFELVGDDYFNMEQAVRKIAEENGIKNVEGVSLSVTATEGIIKFKIAEDKEEKEDDDSDDKKEEEKEDSDDKEEKEDKDDD